MQLLTNEHSKDFFYLQFTFIRYSNKTNYFREAFFLYKNLNFALGRAALLVDKYVYSVKELESPIASSHVRYLYLTKHQNLMVLILYKKHLAVL